MDKSKKTSGKKNKTVGSSQSAAKGRDVTDSGNVRDKAASQAAAAASATVQTTDEQKQGDELKRLTQENQELMEIKRRHEAEISALRRNRAQLQELLNSLGEVGRNPGDAVDVSLEQVLNDCIHQREELLEIKKLSERQSVMLKKMREAVTSRGCPHCTFRRSYEDLDVPLMTAVQCTEAPGTDPRQIRQVLLNDGRQFMLTPASRNDSDVATFPTNPSRVSASHADHMQVTADRGSRPGDDAELPNDLSLRDEALTAATADSVVPPCPVCLQSNFATHMELNLHVNTRHLDREREDFFD